MQRRDPGEIGRLPHGGGTRGVGGVGLESRTCPGSRLPGRTVCRDTARRDTARRNTARREFLVLVAGVVLLEGVIAVFVGHLVLDKAEIDRHLVDRAGHPSALRGPWPAVRV